MYTASPSAASGGFTSFPRRAVDWLDSKGKPAWLAAMILGFVFVWPVGLGILAYMIWSKRMFKRSGGCGRAFRGHQQDFRAFNSSGNSAFDAYKAETLRRLMSEQEAFESFLQRLREAKDKSEFDTFMEDRARNAGMTDVTPTPPVAPEAPRPGAY